MAMIGWDELRSSLDAVPDSGQQAELMIQVGNYYFQRDRFDAAIDAYSEVFPLSFFLVVVVLVIFCVYSNSRKD